MATLMAKAAKPNFLHVDPTASPKISKGNVKKKRERMAKQTGVYKDPRAEKHGQMRHNDSMTPTRWLKVLSAIAHGKTRVEAAKDAKVSIHSIDAYLISNVAAYKQLRDSILAWNRRTWPSELIDNIFNDLAIGLTLKAAALKNGVKAEQMSSLYKVVRHDKAIREAYDDARQLQAESFLDEIIDIADDSGQDRLENGRINHEVVNRSKIRIDTRRFAMGAMVKKRFGDTKHIDVDGNVTFNHIAMLTGARKRLEKVKGKREPVTIEGEKA